MVTFGQHVEPQSAHHDEQPSLLGFPQKAIPVTPDSQTFASCLQGLQGTGLTIPGRKLVLLVLSTFREELWAIPPRMYPGCSTGAALELS